MLTAPPHMLKGLLKKIITTGKGNQTLAPPVEAVSGKGSLPEVPAWGPGDTILDRYLVKEVFSGAMGKVYIAEHLGWKIPVAIKCPRREVLADQEGAKRILTEADSWIRMGMHPNVATCYYMLKVKAIPLLFIEFVDGGDLKSWLDAGRCKDLRTSLDLAIQFCHGMEFTHSKGIIHRDIKPQNILLTKNALLKITDFGIIQQACRPSPVSAKLKNASRDSEATIGFRGTPGYASPEQFEDSHAVDRRTDIFSFGICLWMMLCGKKPYKHNAIAEQLAPVPQNSDTIFPEILTTLLTKAVAFKPEDRYANFTDLRHDLNQAYIKLFKINCPYMELDFADLQAESFNNRGVSFLELGKIKEGRACLLKALDLDDRLPEAIYNYSLLKWQHDQVPTDFLFRQLEAARQRLPDDAMLDALARSVKCEVLGRTWQTADSARNSKEKQPKFYPEYTLCIPRNSVEVFRSSQLHKSAQENIKDLLANSKFSSCYEVLNTSWMKTGFRKDKLFIDSYEALLPHSTQKSVRTVIRLATMPGNGATADQLTFLPGTRKMLVLSKSGQVLIRPYCTKKKINALGKFSAITAMAVSQDGSYLAMADKTGNVQLLSMKTGAVKNKLKANSKVLAMAFSYDSRRLALGTEQGLIQAVNLNTGAKEVFSAANSGPVKSLSYVDKNYDLVSGSEDGTLRFWTTGTEECLRIVNAHAMTVATIRPAANGLFFITSSADRMVKVWNRQTGQCMKSIAAHDDLIRAAIMLPDNKHFISGSDDDIIKIWDVHNGACLYTLDGRGNGICSLSVGPKPHIFLAGCNDGTIVAWMVIHDLVFS